MKKLKKECCENIKHTSQNSELNRLNKKWILIGIL